MSNRSLENNMKNATVKSVTPTVTATEIVKPVTVEETETPVLTTRHLAKHFNLKPTHLRRILRSMKEYNDGLHTNYAWAGWNDPMIAKIRAAVHARAVKATDKAIEAKAEAAA